MKKIDGVLQVDAKVIFADIEIHLYGHNAVYKLTRLFFLIY